MKPILSTLLSLLIAAIGYAQQPGITKSIGKNIRGNVHCGLQDKAGHLWFGTTANGVYRYNGKSFTNLTKTDGLPGISIYDLMEDKQGNIWMATDAGICRYNGKDFTAIPLSASNNAYIPVTAPALTISPRCLMQDKDGNIWVGTNKGIYRYNGARFTRLFENDNVANPNKLQFTEVQSILQDRAGNIWFTTWFEGICRYDGKSITSFKPNKEVWFSDLAEDKEGNIWVGRRDKGVCRYDGKTFSNVLQHGPFDSCGINTITVDKAGNIWFGTESGELTRREEIGGAWRYDGKTFKNFLPKDGLTHYAVFCIVEDRAGDLWFGTRHTGLGRYDGKTITAFSD